MRKSLHDAWWRVATQGQPQSFLDAVAARALSAGALVYRAAVALRNAAYDRGWTPQAKLPSPVVSVGNLTVGGTGKTACVELLANKLTAMGKRVAVLTRGYGGSSRGPYWLRWETGRLVMNGQPAASLDGLADEPQLLARHLEGIPIMVGARRDRSGQAAWLQFDAEALVLDDGFQHRRVARDCNIVLVHARMPFGGWALLPRGPMREPLSSLKRADVVIITKADEALETIGALSERLRSFAPQAVLVSAVHEPSQLVDGLTGEVHAPQRLNGLRVGLCSSIGDPQGFESTVQRLHATILWHAALPDHHRYQSADWEAMRGRATQGLRPDALVTTEKDWIRLRPLIDAKAPCPVPLWVLGVRMKLLSGEQDLDARLARLYVH